MDLRGFLKRLEEVGQLLAVDEEVDRDLQASALCALSNRSGGPAAHFKKVKGYPDWSLAGSLLTGPSNLLSRPERPWSRQALALGLPANADYETFMGTLLERWLQPIPPITVSTGPCKDVILRGPDADLGKLPIPRLTARDGGAYGTMGVVAVRDPETGQQHCGWYRWMVVDGGRLALSPQHLTAPFLPRSGLAAIHAKYRAAGRPMPVAIVMGGDPAYLMAAAMFLPPEADQTSITGGLRREPLTLAKAETADVFIPADAEVVIEGEVSADEMVQEGPFPQLIWWTPLSPAPLLRVTAVTHRQSPILPFSAEGEKYSDALSLISTCVSLALFRFTKETMGRPVRWLYCPPETLMAFCVASMWVMHSGHPAIIARHVHAHPLAGWFDKILVCEEEVEPADWQQILQELTEKANPATQWQKILGAPSFTQRVYANSDEKHKVPATRMYVTAFSPTWWDKTWIGKRISFENSFPEAVRQRVVARWKELGLPGEPVIKKPVPVPQPR